MWLKFEDHNHADEAFARSIRRGDLILHEKNIHDFFYKQLRISVSTQVAYLYSKIQ